MLFRSLKSESQAPQFLSVGCYGEFYSLSIYDRDNDGEIATGYGVVKEESTTDQPLTNIDLYGTIKACFGEKCPDIIEIDKNASLAAMAEFELRKTELSAGASLAYLVISEGVGGRVAPSSRVTQAASPAIGHIPLRLDRYDMAIDFEGACKYHKNYCAEGLMSLGAIKKRQMAKEDRKSVV